VDRVLRIPRVRPLGVAVQQIVANCPWWYVSQKIFGSTSLARNFAHDAVWVRRRVEVLELHERVGRPEHGAVGHFPRPLRKSPASSDNWASKALLSLLKPKSASTSRPRPRRTRDAHFADGELARVAPVGVVRASTSCGGTLARSSIIALSSFFPSRAQKAWKFSPPLAFLHVALEYTRCTTWGIAFEEVDRMARPYEPPFSQPFAPIMTWNGERCNLPTWRLFAVEAQIGHVVLPAGIEAAADLDAEVLDRLVDLHPASGQPGAQLAGQPARAGDAQLARVGARAGHDIHNRSGARSPSPAALSSWYNAGTFDSLTQRSTMFAPPSSVHGPKRTGG